jgi:hypothetical protein
MAYIGVAKKRYRKICLRERGRNREKVKGELIDNLMCMAKDAAIFLNKNTKNLHFWKKGQDTV